MMFRSLISIVRAFSAYAAFYFNLSSNPFLFGSYLSYKEDNYFVLSGFIKLKMWNLKLIQIYTRKFFISNNHEFEFIPDEGGNSLKLMQGRSLISLSFFYNFHHQRNIPDAHLQYFREYPINSLRSKNQKIIDLAPRKKNVKSPFKMLMLH